MKNRMENRHDKEFLKELQALPLQKKILLTQARIIEWYNHFNGNVYVSFSGGKDSTVLLNIARQLFPEIEAVFVDTGLEYPEIREFVKGFENVTFIKPKMRFDEVVRKYGYPVASKEIAKKIYELRTTKSEKLKQTLINGDIKNNGAISPKWLFLKNADFKIDSRCCNIMKKNPLRIFEKNYSKKPIIGTMATESRLRRTNWIMRGCNSFDGKQNSKPMSFWTEQDILQYLHKYNIKIANIYGDIVANNENLGQLAIDNCMVKLKLTGVSRTGCMFCMFGVHMEKSPNRFERMKTTHPKIYNYCIGGGEYSDEGLWQATKQGLGLKKVLDAINVKY